MPDDVIELVLDIMQEERVQHELVITSRVASSWKDALSAYMNEVD